MAKTKKSAKEITVEDKLRALYRLQLIDSSIDKLRTVRGELPLEVEDLQDEIEGLETRLNKSGSFLRKTSILLANIAGLPGVPRW